MRLPILTTLLPRVASPATGFLAAGLLATGLLAGAAVAQHAGEYKFDETSGTTAADATTNKNDGTLINFAATGAWTTGKFGNAITFDGTDDYLQLKTGNGLPVYNDMGRSYTIAFWVNGSATADDRVYCESSSSSNSPLVGLGTGTGTSMDKLRLYFRNDAGTVIVDTMSNGTVFDNTWHHVCWVDASGETRLYIDGKLDSSNHYIHPPGSAGYGTMTVDTATVGGVYRTSLCCSYNGAVDDLRLYAFAVKPGDLGAMMNNVSLTPPAGSIGFWGEGCNGVLSLWGAGSTAPGGTFNLAVTRGQPGQVIQLLVGAPINPLDLSAIGFTGCVIYPNLATSLQVPIGALNPSGSLHPIPLPIPNNSALVGRVGVIQAAALSATSLELSSAMLLMVGR